MLFKRFIADRRGATALMFGLSIIPLMLVSGVAIDYARALRYSIKLKTASDAAALAAATLTSDPSNPYTTVIYPARLAVAQAAFNANIASESSITGLSMSLTEIPNGVRVAATGTAPNMFGGILGSQTTVLGAASEAGLGTRGAMEVAFVLDNTGSMAASNKMVLLKAAMHKFLNKLAAATITPGDVKVALVPFDTQVRIDPIFASGKPWLRQPLSALSGWTGCLTDRVQPYDTNAATPNMITPDTLFDAITAAPLFPLFGGVPSCGLAQMMPLTTNFSAYGAAVDSMSPNGATDGTIGLAWGLQMLTPGDPWGTASAFGGGPRKIIVFLTDGANTRNRTTDEAADIDARMSLVCSEIKSKGVELFTIGLMDANMAVLTPCAGSPQMSFQVTSPGNIPDLFELLSQQLVTVRITK